VIETLKAELGGGDKELTLVLVDDLKMQQLNREHRGEDAPTDVLSYPLAEPEDEGFPEVPHLGDVVISLDTAARQAAAQGHTVELEVVTLAAHGLTHLLGCDHQTEEAWTTFHQNQARARALLARFRERA
jgi:probable rRNA maturation factor